ncbi:hypothetical protein, partial [Acidisphaera rubrifaciens]|uniref:hypothetical protein n=1 Tax=Acidisphaera rubrifaciens TaxID=50715 RepID=UPI0019D6E39F
GLRAGREPAGGDTSEQQRRRQRGDAGDAGPAGGSCVLGVSGGASVVWQHLVTFSALAACH